MIKLEKKCVSTANVVSEQGREEKGLFKAHKSARAVARALFQNDNDSAYDAFNSIASIMILREKECLLSMTYSVLMTDYYSAFSCTGSACAYNCCQNWGIDITRADYNKIRSAKKGKELQAKLKEGMKRHKDGIDTRYAFFQTTHQACAMLRADGLCELQAECGPQILPRVCRAFPRILGTGKDIFVRACTAGCPEIMKELMMRKTPLAFVQDEETSNTSIWQNFEWEKTVHPLVRHGETALATCVDILQNRTASLSDRIVMLGMALRSLIALEEQEQQEGPQEQAYADWRQQYVALGESTVDIGDVKADQALLSNVLLTLRLSTKQSEAQFVEIIRRIEKALCKTFEHKTDEETLGLQIESERYHEAQQALQAACDVDAMMENIMVNYLFSQGMPFAKEDIWQEYLYFCQLYSYLRFAAIGCYQQHKSIDKLICDLTICYRSMVHNHDTKQKIVDYMKENDCSTLAHMAMLVRG